MEFKVGDKVVWISGWRIKRGTIVAIVRADARLIDAMRGTDLHDSAKYNNRNLDSRGSSRNHDSYIVSVPSKSGKGKPTLFWPRVIHLELDNETE